MTVPARRIAAQCWVMRARAVSRLVTQIYDEALRPLGIKTSQVNLLIAIGAIEAASPGQLALELSLEKSTVSRNAEALKKRGWVNASPSPRGRGQILRLTPAGADMVTRIEPAWACAQAELERRLGGDVEHLESLRARLTEHSE